MVYWTLHGVTKVAEVRDCPNLISSSRLLMMRGRVKMIIIVPPLPRA